MRNLEREIAKLCRKAVTEIVKGKTATVVVTPENLEEYLGVRRFKYGLAEESDQVGAVTGLAWTEVGGDLLSIEALKLPGKGRMKTTGKLGDVMKELIDAASSWVRSKAPELGLKPPMFEAMDIHVHVPEGATPKDGPSAGIAMVTSIVSVLTGIPVRRDVAMTGEVTLRGNVLPIGGLEGEAAGGAARRHHHGDDPGRQREGPARHPGHGEERADAGAGLERHGRAADGADPDAGADRVGRGGRGRRGPRGRGGGARGRGAPDRGALRADRRGGMLPAPAIGAGRGKP